jgi:hypothetical protein
MADITDYSESQQKIIKEIISNDNGFHTSYMIADLPLYGMLEETDNGKYAIKKNVMSSLGTSGSDYTLNLWYSVEQKCWFYNLSGLSGDVRGVVHYNTVFNAMGELAFVILNDNITDTELTNSLPYSNVLVMRK